MSARPSSPNFLCESCCSADDSMLYDSSDDEELPIRPVKVLPTIRSRSSSNSSGVSSSNSDTIESGPSSTLLLTSPIGCLPKSFPRSPGRIRPVVIDLPPRISSPNPQNGVYFDENMIVYENVTVKKREEEIQVLGQFLRLVLIELLCLKDRVRRVNKLQKRIQQILETSKGESLISPNSATTRINVNLFVYQVETRLQEIRSTSVDFYETKIESVRDLITFVRNNEEPSKLNRLRRSFRRLINVLP